MRRNEIPGVPKVEVLHHLHKFIPALQLLHRHLGDLGDIWTGRILSFCLSSALHDDFRHLQYTVPHQRQYYVRRTFLRLPVAPASSAPAYGSASASASASAFTTVPPPSPSPPPSPPPPLPPSPSPPPSPPLPSPSPDVGVKGTSDSATTQDAGPGLAIGLALGVCLLVAVVAVLGAVACNWYRKRRMQTPTGSSTRAPQQVEVTNQSSSGAQTMSVQVPQGLQGGTPMQVQTPGGVMQVQIPAGLQPGTAFKFQVPTSFALTAVSQANDLERGGGVPATTGPPAQPQVQLAMQKMSVQVPQGLQGGMPMQVQTAGGVMQVLIPAGLQPGTAFEIQVPRSNDPSLPSAASKVDTKAEEKAAAAAAQARAQARDEEEATLATAIAASLAPPPAATPAPSTVRTAADQPPRSHTTLPCCPTPLSAPHTPFLPVRKEPVEPHVSTPLFILFHRISISRLYLWHVG